MLPFSNMKRQMYWARRISYAPFKSMVLPGPSDIISKVEKEGKLGKNA